MSAIAIPTIHINGTSQEELMNGYMDAIDALRIAISKIEACGPNGRDYYPQGAGAMTLAQAQHTERLHKLGLVSSELIEIAEAVC